MFCESKIELYLQLILFVFCGQTLCSYGGEEGGFSFTKRQQDDWGNYMFNYEIKDPAGAQNYRSEKGDKDNNIEGSYGIQDVDGRMRVVDYWADKKNGFTAKIRSNEPGVGSMDTAYAIFNGLDKNAGEHEQLDIDHNYSSGKGSDYSSGDKPYN